MAAKLIPVPTKPVEVLFPTFGIDVTSAYARQRPSTTPAAQNLRGMEGLTMRNRGGTRPALTKYINQQLPGGSLVQELQTVVLNSQQMNGGSPIAFVQLGDQSYPTATTATPSVTMPSNVVLGDLILLFFTTSGALLPNSVTDNQLNFWTQVSAFSNGNFITQSWYTYATATGPLTITGHPNNSGTAFRLVALEFSGVHTVNPLDTHAGTNRGSAGDLTLALTVNGSLHYAVCSWTQSDGNNPFTPDADGFTTRLSDATADSSRLGCLIRTATVSGGVTVGATTSAPNGSILNTVVLLPGTSTAQSTSSHRIPTLVAVCAGNVATAAAGATAWSIPANISSRAPALTTAQVIRSAKNGTYLYFADPFGATRLNLATMTVEDWTATAGSIPSDSGNYARLICTWRGRTVLSGIETMPQAIYLSKVDVPTDWNSFPTPITPDQAVTLTQGATPNGLIGDIVTALVPYSDDVLFIGGDDTIWCVQGDPAQGGVAQRVSDAIGMAWGAPWCRGPDGTLYFLSNRTGLYGVIPGQAPKRISQAIDPLLVGIDTGNNTIRLAWNDRYRGLHVFVTPTTGAAASTHYFWEADTNAWWQDVIGTTTMNPSCCTVFDGNNPGDRLVLIGSWDGYVRAFNPVNATDDDGGDLNWSVWFGPIVTTNLDEMFLRDIQFVLSESTNNDPIYGIYLGATAEAAFNSAPVLTGLIFAGRNTTQPVNRSAKAIWIKVSSKGFVAFEQIRANIRTRGRIQQRSAQGA